MFSSSSTSHVMNEYMWLPVFLSKNDRAFIWFSAINCVSVVYEMSIISNHVRFKFKWGENLRMGLTKFMQVLVEGPIRN